MLDALWFGDCSALILLPNGALSVVGEALLVRLSTTQDCAAARNRRRHCPVFRILPSSLRDPVAFRHRQERWVPATTEIAQGKHQPLQWNIGSVQR